MVSDIKGITEKIKKFCDERERLQSRNHKDMALSSMLEAEEVLGHFQWKKPEEVEKYSP